jgi:hypothetical protein
MIDLRDPAHDARTVREVLGLAPHPEGGSYREIWRDAPKSGARGAATAYDYRACGACGHPRRGHGKPRRDISADLLSPAAS